MAQSQTTSSNSSAGNSNNQVHIPQQTIQCGNFCDNEFLPGSGPETEVKSPYTNGVIGKIRQTTAADLAAVVEKAQAAQEKWKNIPVKERCAVMFRLRDILLRDIDAISHRISAECGKTLGEARAEIMKGVEVIEFASGLQNSDVGGKLEVSRGVHCEYRRDPVGVVAAITPFNFPAMVPLWMLPIAVTLGNAMIWKPSDKTPLTSELVAKAFQEAGLPKSILNVVQGGVETVDHILAAPAIQAVGFVGSTQVAKIVYQKGSANLKRVLALGGAKNHILLMPDADLELTGKGIADSFTGCAGQRCMAASVLCAVEVPGEEEKLEALIQAIVEHARRISLGRDMGAIISQTSLRNLQGAIEQAEKEGARVLLDGRRTSAPAAPFSGGNWLGPTVLDHVKPGSRAATEELFGPVLAIVRCKSVGEALKIQNAIPYGNAVSVFTQNGGVAEHVARHGRAGMVGINIGVPVPREPFSFGGVYESKFGHGDITGEHSLDLWSNIRKVTTKWAAQADGNWMS